MADREKWVDLFVREGCGALTLAISETDDVGVWMTDVGGEGTPAMGYGNTVEEALADAERNYPTMAAVLAYRNKHHVPPVRAPQPLDEEAVARWFHGVLGIPADGAAYSAEVRREAERFVATFGRLRGEGK